MPLLDSCITSIFEPGNIGASPGTPPTVIVPGSSLDPGTYDPDAVTYSLDFSKFYNSGYLLLLMAGGGPATLGGITDPPLISGPGNISLTLAEQQNTLGFSEGLPKGLPSGFDWYNGYFLWTSAAPAGMTAMTGYGHLWQAEGAIDATIPGLIMVRNTRAYVRLTADKSWVQVQDQTLLEGGHFIADYSTGATTALDLIDIGGGVWTMDGPALGWNNHWWPNPRGVYTADTVDGAFVIFEIRVTDPAAVDRIVAGAGIDWWLDADAEFLEDHSTNPAGVIADWVLVTTDWKPVCAYTAASKADFELSLPPPVIA